jgi:hypothetical protein
MHNVSILLYKITSLSLTVPWGDSPPYHNPPSMNPTYKWAKPKGSPFTMLEPLTNYRRMSHTRHCNIKRDTICHVTKLYQKIDEFEIKLAKHLKRLKIAINLFVSILQEKSWTVEGHHGQNMFILPASQVKEYAISNTWWIISMNLNNGWK